jgi:hypothetical protein
MGGAACESTVLLGGECLSAGKCVESPLGRDAGVPGDGDQGADDDVDDQGGDGDGDEPDDDDSSMDSGAPDDMDAGERPDPIEIDAGALPVLDAGPGTPAPALRNPSFERTSGSGAGDLNWGAFRAVQPWYVCLAPTQTNFVRVEENVKDGNVLPSDGRYFIGFSYMYVVDLTVPIAQELATPLKAGQRYAFLMDVRAESGGDDQLGLIVRGGTKLTPCAFLTDLAETDYLPNAQWTTQCVTFTPQTDLTQIAFLPKNKNGIAVFTRFFIDNIRTDPSCQ